MKTLWQVLGEQKAPENKSLRGTKGYWTPEKKELLKRGIQTGLSNKEITRTHFPELSHRTIEDAVSRFRPEFGVSEKRKGLTPEKKELHSYWSDDKKYLLKRAWNAGKPREDIHLDHFSDLSFAQFKRTTLNHGPKWGLKDRSKDNVRVRERYQAQIDDEARGRIVSDLKKTGSNIESVARKHYASPARVKKIRDADIGIPSLRRINHALIPDEHIEFVKSLQNKL